MRRWAILAMATTLVIGTVAQAQSPTTERGVSTPPTPAPPAVSSPYWSGGYDSVTGSDLPAADIRAVPPARANATRSYWTHQEALSDLNNAVRLAKMQMDREPGYRKAVTEEKAAYEAMQTARTQALSGLQNMPAYAGAEQLHQSMSEQITQEHEQKKPDPSKLLAMARLKISYVKDNRKFEADALARDARYQDARKTYLLAAARLRDYDDAQTMAIATDDSIASLRRAVSSARVEKLTAAAYYDSMVRARRDALDYAGDVRDFYRGRGVVSPYSNAYGYGGYGSYGGGYGYGYGAGYGTGNGPRFVYGVR